MAVETPTTAGQKYDVFYTSIQDGHWTAQDLHYYVSKDTAKTPVANAYLHTPDMIVGSTRAGANVVAVIGYRDIGMAGNTVPFSLVQIGKLPIWAYKFPSSTSIGNNLVAYDKSGNPLT